MKLQNLNFRIYEMNRLTIVRYTFGIKYYYLFNFQEHLY